MKGYEFKLMTFCFFLAMPGWGSPGKSFTKNYSFLTIFAASSIWMILIPFFSRSRTSSRITSAICITCVFRLMSSRGNDQFKIVTGPVNIPFTGALVQLCANVDHSTVMADFLETSLHTTGGFTQRVP